MEFVETSNCLHGPPTNINNSKSLRNFLSEDSIVMRTDDCNEYFKSMYVIADRLNVSRDDDFPMAYSHLIHHDIGIFETFMAIHFRPKDLHCIYVDLKASGLILKAVKGLIKCYNEKFSGSSSDDPAVFLYEYRGPVWWGHISVLDADLACLRQLVNSKREWKYFMNLAGSELPLKTVAEMHKILKNLDGQSITEGGPLTNKERLSTPVRFVRYGLNPFDIEVAWWSEYKRAPVSFNLTVLKSHKNTILSYNDAKFMVVHPVALEYFNWMQDMSVGDESFYPTLGKIVSVNQVNNTWEVIQDLEKNTSFGQCSRSSLWYYDECKGQNINSICNVGVEDLSKLRSQPCFMGNKFNINVDVRAIACQFRYLYNKTLLEFN